MFGAQNRVLRNRPVATQPVKAAAKAPVKEKKRSVLGDVSNVNSQEDKDTKKKKQIKAVKPQPKLQGKTRKKLSEPKAVTAAVVEKVVALKPSKTIAVKKVKKAPEPTQRRTRSSDQNTQVLKKLKTQEYDDLDQDDFEDPMMVSEYVTEIFEYLRELEVATMPNENYMDQQKELQWKMRSILVDWLIEVHVKFRLLPETLYLAVNIIDRFLSLRVVSLVKLQLVGLTSLFIASKYEEVVSPSIQNFLYMAEDGYTEDEIVRAERYVLQVLKFNLQYPTPMSFLRRSSKADDYDIQTRTLAKYLMEITLLDQSFLKVPASAIAASGHYLARHMLKRGPWNKNLAYYSGYTEEELEDPVTLMLEFLKKPVKYEAIYKKYSQRKFMKGAVFVKDWVESHLQCLHPLKDHPMNSVKDLCEGAVLLSRDSESEEEDSEEEEETE